MSYLILRGRCRDCHTRISPVYPLVEILTAAVLVATFYCYGPGPESVKFGVLGMLLLILIFTDFFERLIPHPVTILGIALGLLFSFFIPVDDRLLEWLAGLMGISLEGTLSSVLGAISGALLGGGLFYAVGEGFYRLTGREGLGFGDVMLMTMVGSFLGIPLTLVTILLGSIGGVLVSVPLHMASERFRNYPWPFGTFLGIAAIYSSLGGTTLLDTYLRWSGLAR